MEHFYLQHVQARSVGPSCKYCSTMLRFKGNMARSRSIRSIYYQTVKIPVGYL